LGFFRDIWYMWTLILELFHDICFMPWASMRIDNRRFCKCRKEEIDERFLGTEEYLDWRDGASERSSPVLYIHHVFFSRE
jgi:hypothetical protein